MQLLTASNLGGYELLESGDGMRLERLGSHEIVRPDPMVLWPGSASFAERCARASASFSATEKSGWVTKDPSLLEGKVVSLHVGTVEVSVKVRLAPFRHIGVFPEQEPNWRWLHDRVTEKAANGKRPKVLNLFAYTGVASVVGALAGAEVCHVDASKPAITSASENAELNGVGGKIRWMLEDARKFMQREVRRGSRYDVIIMDPPVFGRGPKGEVWRLGDGLAELLELAKALAAPGGDLLVNTYASELYPLVQLRLAQRWFPQLELYGLGIEESLTKKPLQSGYSLRS